MIYAPGSPVGFIKEKYSKTAFFLFSSSKRAKPGKLPAPFSQSGNGDIINLTSRGSSKTSAFGTVTIQDLFDN